MLPRMLSCIGVLLVVASRFAHADLDVAIPPGTPLEWRYELPFHAPEGHRGPIYTHTPAEKPKPAPADDAPRGRTIVVVPAEKTIPPPPIARFGSFNPMGAARILTLDIVGHMPYTQWKIQDRPPVEADYPPRTRADLYWLVLTAILRPILHPAKVSQAEIANYLILIGPPVHDAMGGGHLGQVTDLMNYVQRSVPPVPDRPPSTKPILAKISDPETRMLISWAAQELVADHPYAYNPLWARRTISLGAEAIPVLLACARSDHATLLENSVGLLASYDSYDDDVLTELRKAAKGKDAVARNRAIEGLVRRGDSRTDDMLLKAMAVPDRYFALYAVSALGRMGSMKALPRIQSRLKSNPADRGEAWMVAISAVSRLADVDGKSKVLLRKIVATCKGHPQVLEVGPGGGADVPDPPGDRADLIAEEATIALARLGDEPSRKQLLEWLGKPVPDPAADDLEEPSGLERALAQRNTRVDPVLGELHAFNQLLAIEALAQMGEPGRALLRNVVAYSADFILRGYALDHVVRLGLDGDFVLEIARKTGWPSVLRVQAMEAIARVEATRKVALEVARSMVRDYVGKAAAAPAVAKARTRLGTDDARIPPYECLSALKILGRHEPESVATIVQVIERARAQGDYERIEAERAPAGAPGLGPVGPGQVNQLTLRAFPPLFETAVVELGRLGKPEAAVELLKVLRDVSGPGRVEAVLGLGNVETPQVLDALLEALTDREPWVRYGAYRSLKKISFQEHFADWIFGTLGERQKAIVEWKAWRATRGS